MDSHSFPDRYGKYEWIMAEGAAQHRNDAPPAETDPGRWIFGHVCYEQKDAYSSKIFSGKTARQQFPQLRFFTPETVCYRLRGSDLLHIESEDPEQVFKSLSNARTEEASLPPVRFTPRTPHARYLDTVARLREHIAAGDCYEVNYCCEWFAEQIRIDPVAAYRRLCALNPAPFSALYRCGDSYMMGASPERFFCAENGTITAQPMKGTAPRGRTEAEDLQLSEALQASAKERAENVMIVDLLRNDLSRIAETGTVTVPRLFDIHRFPSAHQLVSDVQARLRPGVAAADLFAAVFPSGSMTGAPKIRVMQLTEQYEDARRELYSGTIGYIDPDGRMDFNVVIRSLFYHSGTGYLSYLAGGAITYDSDPQAEWEEIRLKAAAMERIFQPGDVN